MLDLWLCEHKSYADLKRLRILFAILLMLLAAVVNSQTRSVNALDSTVVTVNVDTNVQIGTNNLKLGTQVEPTMKLPEKIVLKNDAKAVGFGLIRIFLYEYEPCTSWNEKTCTGTFDWSSFDKIIQAIHETGSEPLVCIDIRPTHPPPGMYVDPSTKLPRIESIVEYSGAVAKHAKEKALNVNYWEVLNEPQYYAFKEMNPNGAVVALVVKIFNEVSARIHSVLPNSVCGLNCCNVKAFLDYFVKYGQGVGFLGFHKYDTGDPTPWFGDSEVLKLASVGCQWQEAEYTPAQMRDVWKKARGEELPIICSETNLNWAYESGTDPRIQQAVGAVWYAEEIRSFALMGVHHSIYYTLASSKTTELLYQKTGGWGFGMMDYEGYDKWYPYLVNYLIGNNLGYHSPLFQATTSNITKVSALAWKNGNRNMILLLNKDIDEVTLQIVGMPTGQLAAYRIDNSSTKIEEEVTATRQFRMKGYTVLLNVYLEQSGIPIAEFPEATVVLASALAASLFVLRRKRR